MERTKSVCVVVPDIGREPGGVAKLAEFVVETLRRSGRYDPTVVSVALARDDEASVRIVRPDTWRRGVRIVERGTARETYLHAGCYLAELEFQRYQPRRELTDLLNRFDVVHVVAGVPAWAHLAKNCRAVVFLHAASLVQSERANVKRYAFPRWRYWMNLVTRRLDRVALRRVRLAFVINRWMEAALANVMGSENVVFNPPGVDTGHFRADEYAEQGYILSVSRFSDPRKDARTLIRAYAHLRQAMPDAPRLVLAGWTLPVAEDRELARSLGVETWIDMHENVSGSALADLYRGASLYVLSSVEEGLGIPLLEAMSTGLPVVTTRCGGPESVVVEGETGLFTPVGDAAALADKMGALLLDVEARRRMGSRARQLAVEKFSRQVAARILIRQYDRVLFPDAALRQSGPGADFS